jgi:hypothetical protein
MVAEFVGLLGATCTQTAPDIRPTNTLAVATDAYFSFWLNQNCCISHPLIKKYVFSIPLAAH